MKTLIKWSIIIALAVLALRGLQEFSMFVFVQGYYDGCLDAAVKDGKDGFRDFDRVTEMDLYCQARMKHIWERRHDSH